MKTVLTLATASLLGLVLFFAGAPASLVVAEVGTRPNDARDPTETNTVCPGGVQKIDLAIADIAGGSMVPVTAAIELGLFEKNCVKVNLVKTTGDQSKLLMTGKIDAISEPIELLHLDLMGDGYADILAVRVIADRPTLALVTKSGTGWGRSPYLTDRLLDLDGKTVAVNSCDQIGSMVELSPNATGTQHLRYLLAKVGLRGVCGTPEEYVARTGTGAGLEDTVFLSPQGVKNEDVVKVALSGEVDAAILPSPYHVTKGLRVVVNHVEFPEVPGSALMVMRQWYQQAQNRETISAMNVALKESTHMLMKYPYLAKVMIGVNALQRTGVELDVGQLNVLYEEQKGLWSQDGIAKDDAIASLQWVNMSDLGLVVGLCGCPGTEDSYAFGAIGGADPIGERDGHILFVTAFHSGSFEGLIAHETPAWREAFQKTMEEMGITDPSKLDKKGRGDFYRSLEEKDFGV